MLPEDILDLEIVALMADHIQKGPVAGEVHIVLDTADADCLTTLPMKIAPVSGKGAIIDNDWPGFSNCRIGWATIHPDK